MPRSGQRPPSGVERGESIGGTLRQMNVIALTVFVGVVLATLFAGLFVLQVLERPPGGGQEALLPLSDETPASQLPADRRQS